MAMTATLVGSFSNIIMDYLFVFPMGMGIFGAALATGASPVISIILMSTHFVQHKNTFKMIKIRPSLRKFKDIALLGISSLIGELSSSTVIIVFNLLILGLAGNLGVAAYGIIANIALVVISIFTGISEGMQPIISRAHGLGRKKDTRKILKYGIITAVSIATIIYVISFAFAKPIVDLFNIERNVKLASMAIEGMKIYFLGIFFAGINIVTATFFSSIDKPKKSFLISISRGFIVIIPVAILLSLAFGMTGVWFTLFVTEAIISVMSIVAIMKEVKK
jgi:Na+-driven multidrug efflux pump